MKLIRITVVIAFLSRTEITPFLLTSEQPKYRFKKEEPETVEISINFLVYKYWGQPDIVKIKLPEQTDELHLRGIKAIFPDGSQKYLQSELAQRRYRPAVTDEQVKLWVKDYKTYEVDYNNPYKRKIDLGKLLNFDQSGIYKIQLVYESLTLNDRTGGKWLGTFCGKPFTVTID